MRKTIPASSAMNHSHKRTITVKFLIVLLIMNMVAHTVTVVFISPLKMCANKFSRAASATKGVYALIVIPTSDSKEDHV